MVLVGANTNAQTIIFQENFNTVATQNLWTFGDRDGDTESWEYLNAELNELPTFEGDAAFSFSWYIDAFSPDNTLTSPNISLPADGNLSLSFKVGAGDDELFDEHYAVYVIPANTTFTGNEVPVFEETLDAGYYETGKIVNVDITEYAGQNVQLVFRHYDCEDIFYVAVDDILIEQRSLSTAEVEKVRPIVYQENNLVKIKGFDKVEKVKVFDLSGKLVAESKQNDINIASLDKGIYIVNFYNESKVISRKVVKN